jgi:hypothetical protein
MAPMKLCKLLKTARMCLTCIGLAACAGQMRSVPADTTANHPVNAVSPLELETFMAKAGQ